MNIAALLNIPFKVAQSKLVEDLANAGFPEISAVHGHIFAYIDREKGSQLVDLAKRSGQSKQFLHKLAGQLQQAGYLRKEAHETDRRGQYLQLTAKGLEAVLVAENSIQSTENAWAALLGEEKMGALRGLLEELIGKFRQG
jgi:DNA-binding MarR family transcriptional regulator